MMDDPVAHSIKRHVVKNILRDRFSWFIEDLDVDLDASEVDFFQIADDLLKACYAEDKVIAEHRAKNPRLSASPAG